MSLFKGEGYPLPLKPELKVLILGQGSLAEKAAQAAARAGGEPIRTRSELVGISGLPGNFRAVLRSDKGSAALSLGAVVLAFDPVAGSLPDWAQGALTDISKGEKEETWTGIWAALMTGFQNQPGPQPFERVLDLGLRILETGGTCFLFTPQAKVAGPGVEDKYRRFRENGGVVTRMDDPPRMEKTGEKVRLTFRDPILAQEAGLTVDRAIWDPPLAAPAGLEALHSVLGLDQGPDGWANPDHVLFPPPLTSRAGVFALGGAGGVDPGDPDQETEFLEEHLRRVFNPGTGLRTAVRTAAEKSECALCLTCLRTCPVQAIGWDRGPVVMEAACLMCGQCAGACPAAIIKPLWPEEEGLNELLAGPGQGDLVLACGRIEEEVLSALPQEVKAVRLSCAGRVGREILFRLLALGYERVVVAACHPGNCRSLTGSERAGRVVETVRAELKELGLDPRVVRYAPLAPHQGQRLYGALGVSGG